MSNSPFGKILYVLLDGVGDLPNQELNGLTPLEAAYTPHLDSMTRMGCLGQVITVGKGVAPQSDIAVFNMLGYNFKGARYVGRGVIESIGSNVDFHDGDLALRGNFATVDDKLNILDRRAGRQITNKESQMIAKTLNKNIRLSEKNASVKVAPTIGHRMTIRFRHKYMALSDRITNTDPAYDRVDGIGVAKATSHNMRLRKSEAQEKSKAAEISAKLLNEFSEGAIKLLSEHAVNKARIKAGMMPLNAILSRDAGTRYPHIEPIRKKFGINLASIVDMPVEVGISKVLGIEAIIAGDVTNYEQKALTVIEELNNYDGLYVHIKGPDEFGHDGDAIGKKRNIEAIDKQFFGTLLNMLKKNKPTKLMIIVSADHSTPCSRKAHTDDPVPLMFSGEMVDKDNTSRFTERHAKQGSLGVMMGADVFGAALNILKPK
jgi:2,3-bisphosphoglycerate-independent phosphoglycerate mutase